MESWLQGQEYDVDEPDDAEQETDSEISDDEDEEEAAGKDLAPAIAPRTGARSILRFFGFGQREASVCVITRLLRAQHQHSLWLFRGAPSHNVLRLSSALELIPEDALYAGDGHEAQEKKSHDFVPVLVHHSV